MSERSKQRLMLLFSVGSSLYACDAEPIIEVVPRVKMNQVPHAPDYFCGIMNYGGHPVPVIDFCQLIANRPASNSLHSRIILFNHPSGGEPSIMGVLAEKITETTLLSPKKFIKSGIVLEQHPYLDGVYSTPEDTVQYVEIEKLFGRMKELPEVVGAENG